MDFKAHYLGPWANYVPSRRRSTSLSSPSLESEQGLRLLWPIEYGRSGTCQCPGQDLKKMADSTSLLWEHSLWEPWACMGDIWLPWDFHIGQAICKCSGWQFHWVQPSNHACWSSWRVGEPVLDPPAELGRQNQNIKKLIKNYRVDTIFKNQ